MWLTAERQSVAGSGTVWGWESGTGCTWLNGARGLSRRGVGPEVVGSRNGIALERQLPVGYVEEYTTPETKSRTEGAPPVVDAKPDTPCCLTVQAHVSMSNVVEPASDDEAVQN